MTRTALLLTATMTAIASLAVNVSLGGTAAGRTEEHVIATSFFGMTLDRASHWPDVPIGAVGHQPAFGWYWRERTKGRFTWTDLDGYVSAAEQHDVDFIYELGGNVPALSKRSIPRRRS